MHNTRYFKHLAFCLGVLALLLAGTDSLEARTRKGDRFFKDARAAETERKYLEAYDLYRQALDEDPGDARYQLAFERSRFRAAQEHLKQGQQLRRERQYAEALVALERALGLDPSLDIARQEMKEIQELVEKEKARAEGGEAASEDAAQTEEELAEERRQQVLASLQGPPELRPISRKPINLVINNQTPKVIFETIGKLAGINVLFDPAFLQAAGTTRRDVQLVNASLEQSLEYACLLTKAFWKPVTDNAIFIAADDPNKRREYTDWVVKVFYLRNVNGAQELTEVANNIRQVTNSRFLFPVPSQNALVVRAEKDQVLLIEKLVNDLDKAKPEVVLDVMVFEASRNKTRNLVASLVSGTTNGLSIPIGFTPRSTLALPTGTDSDNGSSGSTSNSIRLGNITQLSTNDFSVSLPGAVFTALMSDSDTRLVQNPQLRALDGMEATLNVGSQVPIAQGAFSSGIGGGAGGLPFANTQFNFQQVGTQLVMTPRVMGENDVYLKLKITISSVLERIDVGGVQQPVIGNREVSHEVRLRAGEINLIGGLLSTDDSRSLSGTAGLANIPILGRLFSGETITRRDQDVFIALVPRIIRKFEVSAENSRMISAGTDQIIKLSYATAGEAEAGSSAAAGDAGGSGGTVVPVAPVTPVAPGVVMPGGTQPAQPAGPEMIEQVGAPPAPPESMSGRASSAVSTGRGASARDGRGASTPGQQSGRGATPNVVAGQEVGLPEVARMGSRRGIAPSGSPQARFSPPGLVVQPGGLFSLALDTQAFADLKECSFQVTFPTSVLRLREVRQGSLLTVQGERYTLETKADEDGASRVTITLKEGQEAVSGNGSLVVFQFEAVASGTASIQLEDFNPRNVEGVSILQSAPSASIRVP